MFFLNGANNTINSLSILLENQNKKSKFELFFGIYFIFFTIAIFSLFIVDFKQSSWIVYLVWFFFFSGFIFCIVYAIISTVQKKDLNKIHDLSKELVPQDLNLINSNMGSISQTSLDIDLLYIRDCLTKKLKLIPLSNSNSQEILNEIYSLISKIQIN